MYYIQFPKDLLKVSCISANAKILYCILYDMQRAQKAKSRKDYVEISQKTLALKIGLKERQTINLIYELQKKGFITIERYRNDSNRYFITENEEIKTKSIYIQFPKKLLSVSYISANAKILYCILYDMQRAQRAKSRKNYVEVKQKTLAIKIGLKERQTRNLIYELEKNKFITIGRYRDVNLYCITEPEEIKTDFDLYIIKKINEEMKKTC